MQRQVAWNARFVVQQIKLHDPAFRKQFVELLDLDDDDEVVELFQQFCNDVMCHELERLVSD